MHNPLSNLINAKGWCVADGATGTNLFNRGLETGTHQNYGLLKDPMVLCGCMKGFCRPGQI